MIIAALDLLSTPSSTAGLGPDHFT